MSALTGLANIFLAALVTLIVLFLEPNKHVRAALCVASVLIALINFGVQRSSTSALTSELRSLKANRWDPLDHEEMERFSKNLSMQRRPDNYEENDLEFITALEDAAPRIRAVRKRFPSKEGNQINLVIGPKS